MPTANAVCFIGSEGEIGKVSARRVFGHLQIDTGPRAFAVGVLRKGVCFAPLLAIWTPVFTTFMRMRI